MEQMFAPIMSLIPDFTTAFWYNSALALSLIIIFKACLAILYFFDPSWRDFFDKRINNVRNHNREQRIRRAARDLNFRQEVRRRAKEGRF